MVLKFIFPTNFYVQFHVPNAKEIIETIDYYDESHVDNSKFTWGDKCSSGKIPLKWEDYIELFKPSLNIFANEFNSYIDYTMYDPWLNLYKRRDFQEVHDHRENDFACVFIINEGKGFGEFYFKDRNYIFQSSKIEKMVNYSDNYIPELKTGDFIVFPSHMLHGVTPHNSDNIRKTLSFNININEVKRLKILFYLEIVSKHLKNSMKKLGVASHLHLIMV